MVKGKVVGMDGEFIIGVIVMEVGIDNGMIIDIDGVFQLIIQLLENWIRILYVGYKEMMLKVNILFEMIVIMFEDFEFIEEVVVVGYGK